MTALKPCPFCGNIDLEYDSIDLNSRFYIICHGCATRGPEADTLKEAAKLWNSRYEVL